MPRAATAIATSSRDTTPAAARPGAGAATRLGRPAAAGPRREVPAPRRRRTRARRRPAAASAGPACRALDAAAPPRRRSPRCPRRRASPRRAARPRPARQVAGGREPVPGILRHRRADDRVERLRHCGRDRARGGSRVVQVRVDLRQLRVARERRAPGERVEQDAAERVDVGAARRRDRRGSARARGSPACRRTAPVGVAARRRRVLREAEVGQVRVLFRRAGDQDVRRLDVAVHQTAALGGVERVGDLGRRSGRRAPGSSPPAPRRQRAQVRALDEAHREIEHALGLAGLEDRHDVGMVDRRGELSLGLEALAEVAVAGELGRDHLQGDGPVEPELQGAVDDSHASLTGDGVDVGSRR